MKIVGIVGSTREDSYNKKIMDHVIDTFSDQYNIENVAIKDLPLFSEDIEKNSYDAVENLRLKIKDADGILIVTPEHNSSVPAALKNAIDWMSRVDSGIKNKPVMIMGGSIGSLGSVRSQTHLRQILNTVGIESLIEPNHEVIIGKIQDKIVDGKLGDERTKSFIDRRFEDFIVWVEKVKNI